MKIFISYIGTNNTFFNKIIKYLNDNYGDFSSFEGKSFSINDFNIEDVLLTESRVVLFDIIPTFEHKLKKLREDLVRYNYPKIIPFIGFHSDITKGDSELLKRISPNFAFNSVIENSVYDEIHFISKTIVATSVPNFPIRNEFAISNPEEVALATFPTFLREISLKHLLIETPFNLNSNRISINNSLIKNIINFDSNNLIYKGTNYSTVFLPNKFSQVFNFDLITPAEKSIITDDVKKDLEKEIQDTNTYSKLFIKKINEQKHHLILEKQNKYINWLKRNIELFKKSYKKTEVFIFSKDFTSIKLSEKLAENLNISIFKQLSPDTIERIKVVNPHYIIWDVEDIYKDCENEESKLKIKDIPFKRNYTKSLQLLINELGINYFNKNHLDIFLNFNEEYEVITNSIPRKENISFISKKLNKELANEFLLEKTKDNKHLLIPVKLDPTNRIAEFTPLDSYSTLEVESSVILEFLSESEAILKSKNELPYYTPIKVKTNEIEFTITLIPNEKFNKDNLKKEFKRYHGFLNNITEINRQQIRSFVIKHEKQNSRMA